jgi:hypothetical protein
VAAHTPYDGMLDDDATAGRRGPAITRTGPAEHSNDRMPARSVAGTGWVTRMAVAAIPTDGLFMDGVGERQEKSRMGTGGIANSRYITS